MTDQFRYLMVTSDPVISELIEQHYSKPRRRRARRADVGGVDISPLLRDDEVSSSDEDNQEDEGDAPGMDELL